MNNRQQYNLIEDPLPTTFFFYKSYAESDSYIPQNLDSDTPDTTDRMHPAIINYKNNNSYTKPSDYINDYITTKTDITQTTSKSNLEKQKEYLTCRYIENKRKIFDDKIILNNNIVNVNSLVFGIAIGIFIFLMFAFWCKNFYSFYRICAINFQKTLRLISLTNINKIIIIVIFFLLLLSVLALLIPLIIYYLNDNSFIKKYKNEIDNKNATMDTYNYELIKELKQNSNMLLSNDFRTIGDDFEIFKDKLKNFSETSVIVTDFKKTVDNTQKVFVIFINTVIIANLNKGIDEYNIIGNGIKRNMNNLDNQIKSNNEKNKIVAEKFGDTLDNVNYDINQLTLANNTQFKDYIVKTSNNVKKYLQKTILGDDAVSKITQFINDYKKYIFQPINDNIPNEKKSTYNNVIKNIDDSIEKIAIPNLKTFINNCKNNVKTAEKNIENITNEVMRNIERIIKVTSDNIKNNIKAIDEENIINNVKIERNDNRLFLINLKLVPDKLSSNDIRIYGFGITDGKGLINETEFTTNKDSSFGFKIGIIVLIAVILIILVKLCYSTKKAETWILVLLGILVLVIIILLIIYHIGMNNLNYDTYLVKDKGGGDPYINDGIHKIASLCRNINIKKYGKDKLLIVIVSFVIFVLSLVCFFESYTTNKYLYKNQLMKYNFNNKLNRYKKLLGINFKIEDQDENKKDELYNVNENAYTKKYLGESPPKTYILNILSSFIGFLFPFLKIGFDILFLWLYFIIYIPLLIIIRYLIYFVSTILYKYIIKGKGKGKLIIIKQFLSIFFEKHISYFDMYSKYSDSIKKNNNNSNNKQKGGSNIFNNSQKMNNKIRKNMNKLEKFKDYSDDTLYNTNFRSGLNQLPFGLPWMTISTVIMKVISLIYYNIINNKTNKKDTIKYKKYINGEGTFSDKDFKKSFAKINTSDFYYLNFLLEKKNVRKKD